MTLIDLAIIAFVITALFRGREIGVVQQLCSTIGFFGGLFLGSLIEPHLVQLAHSAFSRSAITIATTLGCAFVFLAVAEYVGVLLKHKLLANRLNSIDNLFGSLLSALSVLLAVWLSAAILTKLPYPDVRSALNKSAIISFMSKTLPPAPNIVAGIGHLIDPNGFPDVFLGTEPNPPSHINIPPSSALAAAVNKDKASVVKIEEQGCGGIVEGSGFVIASDLIATNAHVVSGIDHPYVEDANGTHSAVAVWFDPNLDFAVLRVSNLAGPPLLLDGHNVARNTPAAVLGYPGGGGFTADPASVLAEFLATGRNIYGQGETERDVYEVAANVIPGNSGGPLIGTDGTVIGVIFAQSTSYKHVGYALTTPQVVKEIKQAEAQNQTVSTGGCAE